MSVTELKRPVAVFDELDDCILESMTIAELLGGIAEDSTIPDETVPRAGNMIAARLSRAKELSEILWKAGRGR